jgi:predicted phage tail component-like protein
VRFNGFDFSEWLVVAKADRQVLPPVSTTTSEVSGMDGARFVSSSLGTLTITVQCLVRKGLGSRAEVARQLAGMLRTDKPAWLELDDEPGMRYLAMVDGSSAMESLWRPGGFALTFLCCDPVAYGRECSASTSSTFKVGGTYRAWPTFRLTPKKSSAGKWSVTNVATGEYVRVELVFDGKSELIIDCGAQRATYGGKAADSGVVLESDFFALAPGVVELSATQAATVEWTERWL